MSRVEDIDWNSWTPHQEATLLFVIRNGDVLLIHKKRGIGAGKINGPGGRVGPGETPLAAAVREVEEELRVTPRGVSKVGEVLFHVLEGVAIRIHVFRASDVDGEPRETDEAKPLWVAVDRIPFESMWEDDRQWFPLLLEGRPFQARAVFAGDDLVDCEVLSA